MGGDNGRSIQVLNISNINAQGKTVLNDGKLLDLIQMYPFLYNPRVKPYGDTDYTLWAWKRINAAFNRSYENDPFAAFSTTELIDRWRALKPLIQCLSKAYDLDAIPSTLRQSVMKISNELDDPSTNCLQKPVSGVQNLLKQNLPAIEALPREQRLALENEVLDIIFATELEYKLQKKLDDNQIAQAKEEADEFLNEIGYKQVLLTAISQQSKMFNGDVKSSPGGDKWIPLSEAKHHVRRCRVKLKRLNLEDYLPLSKIKKGNFKHK